MSTLADSPMWLQAQPQGAWFLSLSPAGSALGPSGPPPLASTCCPLAVHLLPHCPLSPGLLSARSAGPYTQPAPLSIC